MRFALFALPFALLGCESIVSFDAPRETGEQCGDGVIARLRGNTGMSRLR